MKKAGTALDKGLLPTAKQQSSRQSESESEKKAPEKPIAQYKCPLCFDKQVLGRMILDGKLAGREFEVPCECSDKEMAPELRQLFGECICQGGAGYVSIKRTSGKWRGYQFAKECVCLARGRRMSRFEGLRAAANLTGLEKMTFESYIPVSPSQHYALGEIIREHRGVYLWGPWGVGKTHLAAASVLRAINKLIPSVIMSVPKMIKLLTQGEGEDRARFENMMCVIPYLVMDDIGKEKLTEAGQAALFRVIDERWRLFKADRNIHTSLTSQYSLDPIPGEKDDSLIKHVRDGAIVDRIRDMTEVIVIDGKSGRGK